MSMQAGPARRVRRIPDAGRDPGPLFAALRDRAATVTGFDSSAGMLKPRFVAVINFGGTDGLNLTEMR